MEQFSITKQGSVNMSNWNSRVLSLSRMMGVAAIANPDDATDLFARALRITSVKGWPDYHRSYLFEDFSSAEARLVLRIKGQHGTVAETVVQTTGGEVRRYNFVKDVNVVEEAWMIRFATQADLDRAKVLFARMPRVRTPPVTRQNTEVPPSAVSAR